MGTIIFYGNCQAISVGLIAAPVLERAGYAVRFWPTLDAIGGPRIVLPTRDEIGACVALFEQVDRERFPELAALPAGCGVVRFPSLDTNLLWPFGDRVLALCVEQGWDEEQVVAYYRTRYDDYRVDLKRLAVLERARLRARDEKADVKMSDIIDDVVSRPLFWCDNHPRPEPMRVLVERIATAGAAYVPELAGFTPPARAFDPEQRCVSATGIAIHPGVAAELGLSWYDPEYRMLELDGVRRTHDEHVRDVVRTAIVRRGNAPASARPAIDGPLRFAGPAAGLYPDGFAAPRLRAELEALAPVETFTLELYYPPQHRGAATLSCEFGSSRAEAEVEPGNPVTLALHPHLERGARAYLTLACSTTLNMRASGQGDDDRDLGALVLAMRAG